MKLLPLLFLSTFAAAQVPPNVLISDVNDPEEVSICINPKNTNQLVAGSNIDNVYRSADGGIHWIIDTLHSQYKVWGDPAIVCDTAGSFYFFHLSWPNFGANWIDRIVCQRSDDGGATWATDTHTGVFHPHQQDKAWAAVNPVNNHIYVTWTQFDIYGTSNPLDSSIIYFSKSTDRGLTWSVPKRISKHAGDCVDSDNTVEGAVPAVGSSGEIYVCWSAFDTLWFQKSTDDGATWFAKEKFVATQPGGWDYMVGGLQRCNGLPVTLCNHANGNIYINWSDDRAGNHDIYFCRSADGGNSWSAPLRVNDDATTREQFMSWMAIDQSDGNLYMLYYDRRNYSSDSTDVFLATSTDDGMNWTNQKISASPFFPDTSNFFGDYINISAANGKIRPIWMRMDGGLTSVWTALVGDTSSAVLSKTENGIYGLKNFPNPSSGKTTINFELRHGGKIKLDIYNASGKLMLHRDYGLMTAGEHRLPVEKNPEWRSGMYIYILTMQNGEAVGKWEIEF